MTIPLVFGILGGKMRKRPSRTTESSHAICAAVRDDGRLRLGYALKPWSFIDNAGRKESSSIRLAATSWVLSKRFAKRLMADLSADLRVPKANGHWLSLSVDEFTVRLKESAWRCRVKLFTDQELNALLRQAAERELDAAERRIERILAPA